MSAVQHPETRDRTSEANGEVNSRNGQSKVDVKP